MAAQLEDECIGLLVQLGRPEDALERASRLADLHEASGTAHSLVWVRAVELATRVDRGESGAETGRVDWLVDTARKVSAADVTVEVLASAAAAALATAPDRARMLLAELARTPGGRQSPSYARQLPAMLRTALATRDAELAQRLVDGIDSRYPLNGHALCAARAQLAEHSGEHARAETLYAEAAARWQTFGNVPERAYALLGRGRCLLALDDSHAEVPLRQAQELFDSMGYKPALAETDRLLQQATAPSA
jgi:hypothetical protein